ncbi:MAG: PhnA domain-containing protein [Roseibium sp.]
MSLETELRERASGVCELCGADKDLALHSVNSDEATSVDYAALTCGTCSSQINGIADLAFDHWRCLNDSAWSQTPAVQVIAWRMLNRLSDEAWARDLLDMLYLDDETLEWAKAGLAQTSSVPNDETVVHKDTNGSVLAAGDTVTLIKDLKVKGAGFTAKRGTAVRNISLVHDNANHIEGRVNDQRIVILTEFVKKA